MLALISKMKISILGTGSRAPSLALSNLEIMKYCGQNTGNFIFQFAIEKLFQSCGGIISYPDLQCDEESIFTMKDSDLVVVPCADFINSDYELSGLWSRLQWSEAPIIPIGLGISGTFQESLIPNILPDSLNVFNHFKKFSPVIFVRGEATKSILIKMGFDGGRIKTIGCPSNFISSTIELKERFLHHIITGSKLPQEEFRFVVTGDRYWNDGTIEIERLLYQCFRMYKESIYLLQSHEPLINLIRPEFSDKKFSSLVKDLLYLGECLNPRGRIFDLIDDLEKRYRVYFSADDWFAEVAKFNFSLGLRLHGNMASLQSGVPSLWIAHDHRTSELVETMALPRINFGQLQCIMMENSAHLILSELFEPQVDKYFINRDYLFNVFDEGLKDEGIGLKLDKL
ncbi:polysaccharide pyruvyl transferase family protein [Polynucleobacter paneuropaeus]|uniref:Polysaccharide pyruvyl transferase family protein n=1 Tax=Polynucleobacter paneuropaeus TaxID=2527775 RepID=A0A9Q2WGX9_9BURK|nr:polysaccharide pyruvyl transferase family protein [Polynucleobacter paneuropaeus]